MKAVIFDMDGVLINTEPLHYRCWKEILKEKNGIDLDYESTFRVSVLRGFFMNLINENYGPVFDDVDKMNALMKREKSADYRGGRISGDAGNQRSIEAVKRRKDICLQ